jgi:hypothetical protein
MKLPGWMRTALLATAVMNGLAAILFLPPAAGLRELAGLPAGGHPFYLTTVSLFVALFGVGYLWFGLTGRADRFFIAFAALGKLSFFALAFGFALAGALSFRGALLAGGDLVFAVLFLRWLFAPDPATAPVGHHAHA